MLLAIDYTQHSFALALLLGFLMDIALGDPRSLPHLVRAIGWLAQKLEPLIRKWWGDDYGAGGIFWFTLVGSVGSLVSIVLWLAAQIHPLALFSLQAFLCWQGLAFGDLRKEALSVYAALQANNLGLARQRVSQIVSRNTEEMDEAAVTRSAIESAAENTVDGILSPLFWAMLLGPVGLWVFKAISTLDSMVGYRTPQYQRFGTVSAKMDDYANWIPARIALLLMSVAAWILAPADQRQQCFARTWNTAKRDRLKHASPNSGHGEALAAGYLGVRLGGPAVYHGELKDKPWFYSEGRTAHPNDIPKTMTWILVSTWLAMGLVLAVVW